MLVLFGVVCLGQKCQAKIFLQGRKDTLASIFLIEGTPPLPPGIDALYVV